MPEDDYDINERVAIMIYDGGLSEEAAEYHARRLQREREFAKRADDVRNEKE